MDELAREYIVLARQLTTSGCFSKAFDFYMMAFEKNADMKSMHEHEFRVVMNRFNDVLISANKMEDVFINYTRALLSFPNNIFILNDMGKFLFKCGFHEKAWEYFETAIRLNSTYVNAEKNFNSLKNLLVERWHFRMLNDKIRNDAYRTAIRDSITENGDSVLDIGTGTGLLTMYAYECRPIAITACDGSKAMADLAYDITTDHGYNNLIIVNKMSTEMGSDDIGGKRSLILTEMFDAGLFGEHVLQSITHAQQYLANKDARVLPGKAEFFVIGAQCEFLNRRYQLCSSIRSLLGVPNLNVHVLTLDETYDSEDVHLLGDDIKYMTESQSLIKVDFNHIPGLKKLMKKNQYKVELPATENGEINIVIGFFNLYLTDKVSLTTDPRSDKRANAWQQAIFYDKIPIHIKKNEVIPMEFLLDAGKLSIYGVDDSIIRISPETLRFLNDTEYMNMISGCIGMACVYLGQLAEMSQINIIDLCPFPMFGLQLLKRGAKSLVCCAKTDSDKAFFQEVLTANCIALSRVTILVGDTWSQDRFRDEKYHVVYCSIFEICGEIDLRLKEIAQHLKQHHLLQGGLFLPASIKIMGQIVKSKWLDINNRLFDENVHHYHISKHLNKYKVSQNFSIDFSHLDFTPMSEPCILGTGENPLGLEVVSVPIIKEGYSTAILCWYIIELMADLNEISTYRKESFIDGIVFMTNPRIRLFSGRTAQILRCVDADGAFKFSMHASAI